MYCQNCGKEIKKGNSFCTNCGNSIETGNQNNTIETNNQSKERKIKIKLEHIIFFIVFTIILLVSGCILYKNKNKQNMSKEDINIQPEIEKRKQIIEENISTNTTSNEDLIETIYEKYPEIKEKDGLICTNGEEFWLLDKQGKKIYFDTLESFEKALVRTYTDESNTNEDVNYEDEENIIEQNSKSETIQNNNKYIDLPILTGLTEQQAIQKAKELNIPYEISYQEDINQEEGIVLDQSYHDEIITNYKGEIIAAYSQRRLYPGETLYIFVNKIKVRTMVLDIHRSCLLEKYLLKKQGLYVGKIEKVDSPLDFTVKANGKVIFNDKLTNEDLDIELYNCTTSEVTYTGKTPPEIEIIVNGETFATYSQEEMRERFYDDLANENGEKWYIGFKEHGAG